MEGGGAGISPKTTSQNKNKLSLNFNLHSYIAHGPWLDQYIIPKIHLEILVQNWAIHTSRKDLHEHIISKLKNVHVVHRCGIQTGNLWTLSQTNDHANTLQSLLSVQVNFRGWNMLVPVKTKLLSRTTLWLGEHYATIQSGTDCWAHYCTALVVSQPPCSFPP